MRALAAAALLLGLIVSRACAEPVAVAATPMSGFGFFGISTTFGPLEWRGGLKLSSDDPRFGGFSGLALSADGAALLAVSDRGHWLRARLSYDAGGLSGLGRAEIAPILNRAGKTPQAKWRNDAEALSPWQRGRLSGRVLVGFEGDTRIGVYDLSRDGLGAKAQSLTIPKAIVRGPRNSQLEAIGRFEAGPWQGQVIAISEANRDGNGNIRAWVFGGKMTTAFTLSRFGDYSITDLAVLPDGQVLTLERRYGGGELPGMAIRRFDSRDIANAATLSPELLFEARAPFYQIDNMEGIAVHTSGGELRVTVISDDNFNHELQQTLLMQFRLRE